MNTGESPVTYTVTLDRDGSKTKEKFSGMAGLLTAWKSITFRKHGNIFSMFISKISNHQIRKKYCKYWDTYFPLFFIFFHFKCVIVRLNGLLTLGVTPNGWRFDTSIGGAWFDSQSHSRIFAGCYVHAILAIWGCSNVWFHIEIPQ